jgi:hypothetical protein
MEESQKRVFIGLAHVKANRIATDVLKGANGAYVNILCLATNESEFLNEAAKTLNFLGLNLVDVEDIEPIDKRIEKYEVDDNLLKLVKQVNEENKVMLGTFHAYN